MEANVCFDGKGGRSHGRPKIRQARQESVDRDQPPRSAERLSGRARRARNPIGGGGRTKSPSAISPAQRRTRITSSPSAPDALNQHVANHGDFVYNNCCLIPSAARSPTNATSAPAMPEPALPFRNRTLPAMTAICAPKRDTCDAAGACVGSPIDCSEQDDACNVGLCDPADGSCYASPTNEGGACDDGDACTGPDICSGGVCSGAPISCDDGDPCTDDSCDRSLGCINTPIVCPEGQACLDGECVGCVGTDCAGIEFGCEDDPGCNCFITVEGTGICHRNQLCAGLQSCRAAPTVRRTMDARSRPVAVRSRVRSVSALATRKDSPPRRSKRMETGALLPEAEAPTSP